MKKFLLVLSLFLFLFGALYFFSNAFSKSKTPFISNSTHIISTISPSPTITFLESIPTLNLLLIGDSISKGTGDENSLGITGNIKSSKSLKIDSCDSLGIDGHTDSKLIQSLDTNEFQLKIKSSDIIVVSTGGNDLLTLINKKGSVNEASYIKKTDEHKKSIPIIIQKIKFINPKSKIIFIGLYNPSKKPNSEYSMYLNIWNEVFKDTISEYQNSYFIQTFDIFQNNLNKYLSKDSLHPNSKGYQLISDRIIKTIEGFK